MEVEKARVGQNYLAIVVAAIACFLFREGWYSVFLQPWLKGIGRTPEWLNHTGVNPALQFAVALLAEGVVAAVISWITQASGRQTMLRGVWIGALAWIGFVVPVLAVNCAFEVRTWTAFGIDCGFWFVGMIVMGAIVGGWKKGSVPRPVA